MTNTYQKINSAEESEMLAEEIRLEPRQSAQTLLTVAQRDLRAASGMLDSVYFADEIFGYAIQQATEKLLKAWLAALGEIYPLGYDLNILFERLKDVGCKVEEYESLEDFTTFATVQTRYRGLETKERPIERESAIEKSFNLQDQVKAFLELLSANK